MAGAARSGRFPRLMEGVLNRSAQHPAGLLYGRA